MIEKHFTLSRDSGSPDDAFSLIPSEFKKMVDLSGPDKLCLSTHYTSSFSIGENIIRKVGLFDENYKQAYWEDQDYITNILRDIVTQSSPNSMEYNAEDSEDILLFNKNDEYEIHHVHCGTYKQSSEEHRKHIDDCINRNGLYYNLKWKNKNKAFDIYD